MDLNDVDTPENVLSAEIHQELRQKELTGIIEENIKKQYIDHENLGQNFLLSFKSELTEKDKINILTDFVSYTNKNIISIVNLDDLDGDKDRLLLSGSYLYEFVCVDSYASIIPALMEVLGITSIDDLDNIINIKYLNTPVKFKTDLLSTIQITIDQLLKLKNITPDISNDKNYQRLLGKYFYYQELVDYGDTEIFLNNFLRPVINKYSSDFIWKLL